MKVKDYLSSLSIILPLACKLGILKPPQHLLDPLGGMGQHGLEGDTRSQPAMDRQLVQTMGQKSWDEGIVVWVFTG